jgi:hypothetical protein
MWFKKDLFLASGFDGKQSTNVFDPVKQYPQLLYGDHNSYMVMVMEQAQQIKDAQEYEKVFQQYLQICNRAIEQNRNKFPYTEIWGARFAKLGSDKEAILQAIIYDDRPKVEFTLRLTKDMKIEIVEKKPIPDGEEWPFTYQYLKRVVDNPKEYIENPAKLEWGWLKTVFGST